MDARATFCSKRLGTIEHSKFQAALERFNLGRLQVVTPIRLGNFGQNVFLTTDRGEFVFRGCPHYPWQFPKERYFARLLHKRTRAPVPWPYHLDTDTALFGWAYVLMPKMPGLQIGDPDIYGLLSPDDRVGIAKALGETLAELQCLTHSFCGEYDPESDTLRPFTQSHRERIRSRIEAHIHEANAVHASLKPGEIVWVADLLARADDYLEEDFVPAFVMQDYKEGNLVVDKVDGRWTVTGVFDFMEPYLSDGEIDLCRTLCCYLEDDAAERAVAFVHSYTQQRPLRPGALERFPVYLLLDRFIIWNFGQRHGVWWDDTLVFREWLALDKHLDAFRRGAKT